MGFLYLNRQFFLTKGKVFGNNKIMIWKKHI